ncbi:hypothetical protein ACOQFV_27345 [Nocardiopsis changdeensis]|uniref:Uncharacterized protein n=1 Tax=Nocardiopsis changdeensis TaxID=2831969 RepID=A0ABX8BL81_9ACTN|nr:MULTISPECIES: hypothetical protein [Nocardiopsis]QUX22984.1 hypothetical protein KGD84_00805 [Nocardiopsis changdeensis]QYX38927.1 hypothetical protein K1J57_10255 [Nocardiopsis sp. MT53]
MSIELPRHPRTGLRALGVLPSGRIVWPQLGGDESGSGGDGQGGTAGVGQGGQGAGQAGGDGGQGAGQPGAAGGQQQAGQQPGGQAPPVGPDGQPLDPARLQRLVENLREENRQLKQRGQGGAGGQQDTGQQDGQGQAPGQQRGQAPATDDGTAARLAAATTELAVYRAAGKHGANPVALTDSRSFMDAVGKLDPAAADYDKQVSDAIKKAVADHPHYASGQAPGGTRGGSDGTGRPGAPDQPKGLGAALRSHYAKK